MIKRSAISFIFSAAVLAGFGSAAGAVAADDCPASPQTCDAPGVLSSPQAADPAPTTAVAAAPLPAQTLPVTGSETAALALGGALLVAAGGTLVWRSNKAAA